MEGFEGVRCIQPWTPIAPEEAPRSAKGLYLRLAAHGWEPELLHAASLRRATYYVGASEGHNMGDLKKAAHSVDHFALRARLDRQGQRVARALATWAKERPAEGKKTNVLFDDGHSWDLVGGMEFHRTATSFDEWISVFAPKPEPKRRAQPTSPASVDDGLMAEIAGGGWSG